MSCATLVSPCDRVLDVLEAECGAVCGSRERIDAACDELRALENEWPSLAPRLAALARVVSSRVAAINAPVAQLLCTISASLADSLPILDNLLASHDARVVDLALDAVASGTRARPELVNDDLVASLAARVDAGGPFEQPATLERIASILHGSVSLEALFAKSGNLRIRRLAARLLDLPGTLPAPRLAAAVLGGYVASWLSPYLAYTRATHLDLLALSSGDPIAAFDSFRRAEAPCGPAAMRQLFAEIGWARVNFGVTVRRFVGTSMGGSFPLLVTPVEGALIEECDGARRVFDRVLVVAHGGTREQAVSSGDSAIIGRLSDPVLARHTVTELLLGDAGTEPAVAGDDKGELLSMLVANRVVGDVALRAVLLVVATLTRRHAAEFDRAMELIADSTDAYEMLSLRLDVRRIADLLTETRALVVAGGIVVECEEPRDAGDLEEFVVRRLGILRSLLGRRATEAADVAHLRHLADRIDRINDVIGASDELDRDHERCRLLVALHDEAQLRRLDDVSIVDDSAGGIEIRGVAGAKAANLAHLGQLGEGAMVPPWFALTDHAFRLALESPSGDPAKPVPVHEAIEHALARDDLDFSQKAATIRQAWDSAQLPPPLVNEVTRAYARLMWPKHSCFGPDDRASTSRSRNASATYETEPPFVAVRSSASEEDLEIATRAGEFDTFLFVRGEEQLITHLKRAWSGLWNERALHARGILGIHANIGGGVIVQTMITSRASGVLHTVNVAERRLREMVINAGLGLGEGIVSGAVAADQIVVSKEGDLQHGELHFRYVTADKRERVVFNSRVGSGTAKVETLYHQRLRPSLEYVEICELVRAAARLESAYGYPLDIEFAIEGTNVYLLQVRPIPTPFTVWRETRLKYPVGRRE